MPVKPFDPAHDYIKDVSPDDIKNEDGKEFVYLRGLEKLAKARGIVSASCKFIERTEKFAVCTFRYIFADGAEYDGSADASIDNCDGNFKLYLTAMAESRAKARALRNAFTISMCSVEEKSDVSLVDSSELGPVEEHTVVLIRRLMTQFELGKADAIKMLPIPRNIAKVEELTRIEARHLLGELNKLRTSAKKIKAKQPATI